MLWKKVPRNFLVVVFDIRYVKEGKGEIAFLIAPGRHDAACHREEIGGTKIWSPTHTHKKSIYLWSQIRQLCIFAMIVRNDSRNVK
jgi:hypothetical protein